MSWGKAAIENETGWGRGALTNYNSWGIKQRDSHSGDTIIFGMSEYYSKRITDDGGSFTSNQCLTNFINQL